MGNRSFGGNLLIILGGVTQLVFLKTGSGCDKSCLKLLKISEEREGGWLED